MGRAEQREQTRAAIVAAAVRVFGARGYEGASTRLIADEAGVTQSLVTYHFSSKDDLWRAAADEAFAILAATFTDEDATERDVLAGYVRANAAHPEIFHFIVDAGRHDDERMTWLVETHIRPRFDRVRGILGAPSAVDTASLFYAMVGASSMLFAVSPECRTLTGVDPTSEAAIDAHVELVTSLFLGRA